MNSNRLFFKGMRADFRREAAWFTMYALLFLFIIPVGYLFGLTNLFGNENIISVAEKHRMLYNYSLGLLGMGATTVFLMGAGLLEAYHEFGFLHRRREIDFYHGLPGTRRQLFFSRYINGLVTVLVPYLCALLIGVVCAVLTDLPLREMIAPVCAGVLLNVIIFMMMYSVAILAVMLTGRALTGILGMMILAGYFPLLTVMLESIPSGWFRTYHVTENPVILRVLGELSPATQAICYAQTFSSRFSMPFEYGAVTAGFIFRVLMGFAATLVLILINLKLYDVRPLEKAGEAMVFRKTEPVIRVLLVFFAGVGVMQFMKAIGSELGWILFFTLAAVVIGHIIVELIYRADPRKVLRHKIELAVMMALVAVFVLCVHYDVFGYDRYLPGENKIESAELHFNNGSNMYSIWQIEANGEVCNVWTQTPEYWMEDGQKPVLSGIYNNPEEIAAIRSIAQLGIEHSAAVVNRDGSIDAAYEEQSSEYLYVVWHLKGGGTKSRSYAVPTREIRDAYETLFDSETGRTYMYPILGIDTDSMIGGIQYEENGEAVRISDKETGNRIMDAYLMDLRAMTMKDIEGKAPVAVLRFALTPEMLKELGLASMAEDVQNAAKVEFRYGGEKFFRYPLYETFDNTLHALAEAGIRPGTLPQSTENVEAFSCRGWGLDQNGEDAWFTDEAEDAEDLELIRKNLVLYDYSYYNMYGPEMIGDLEIYWNSGGREYSGSLLANEETQSFADRSFREHSLIRANR